MIFTNILLILTAFISSRKCQTITLYDYTQEDSKSECTNGLASGVDVVLFKCLVDYSLDTDLKYVVFQKKTTFENTFNFLTDCNIQEDCKNSEHIKDPSDASGQLIVNGKRINSSYECRENFPRPELNIVFLCESKVLPCLIEISNNESTESVQGKGHATWRKDVSQQEVSFNFKYAVCRLNGPSQNFNCKFIAETISSADEKFGSQFTFLVVICVVISVLVLCWLCVLFTLFMHKRLPIFRMKTRTPSFTFEDFFELLDYTNPTPGMFKLKNGIDIDIGITDNDQSSEIPQLQYTRKKMFSIYKYYMATESHNLMKDFKSCQKNESHTGFIQMEKFTEQHLPQNYKSSDVFKMVKIVADLTVKVTVSIISGERPAVFKDTHITYPFYENKKDNNISRIGTGLIKRVFITTKEDDKLCNCHKCVHSYKAGTIRGKIYISTTQSLVFDDIEALKTVFQIGFDEINGTYHYIDGFRVAKSHIIEDQCLVECVTCDEDLLKALKLKTINCIQEMAEINSNYNNRKTKDNVTIIVSHPHGCQKHVSIGRWTNKTIVRKEGSLQYTKYAYTTPTCPGSTGAFVYILGVSDILLNHHIHFGKEDSSHGVSGIGMEYNCLKSMVKIEASTF